MASSFRRASKSADVDISSSDSVQMRTSSKTATSSAGPAGLDGAAEGGSSGDRHGVPQYLGRGDDVMAGAVSANGERAEENGAGGYWARLKGKSGGWFRYMKTRDFWVVLALGQVLSICITSTNTLSELLSIAGTNIPAFQTLFNYILLNIIYTSFTLYKYGFRKWLRLLVKDGWRYFILAFMDVEGNYFTVLAYRYTNILSAQLINFWAIVIVVAMSLIFLGVRYHYTQYIGIIICIGGTGVLVASDRITGADNGSYPDAWKGDLWALGGATFYGLSNTFEEFLVSERPLYEVIGQLAFWGMFINGTQAGIFDRASFRAATWDSAVGGYLTGYTLVLTIFYSLAPLMFRLSSAAFFNISLLTGNFWGVCIGTQVFHLSIHWMYPIALVLIIIGHVVYFLTESVMGEAHKPWLGEDQGLGVSGVGTAKRKQEKGSFLGLGSRVWGSRGIRERQEGVAVEAAPGVV